MAKVSQANGVAAQTALSTKFQPRSRSKPLFDMHVHLRGTLGPHLARELAAKNNRILRSDLFDDTGEYTFGSFGSFLGAYNEVGGTIRSGSDLRLVAMAYLKRAANCGAIYVEFMISPAHSIANGISWDEQIDAILAASHAYADLVSTTVIATAIRHHGPEEAVAIARMVASTQHEIVGGFGLTGKEDSYPAQSYEKAFRIASDAGLGLTAHAGEWCNARSILETVDQLRVTRIGHGLSAADDIGVLRELVDRGIGFEVCPSANVVLGSVPSLAQHPIEQFALAGVSLLIGTDDPAFFQTDIAMEYELASRRLTAAQLDQLEGSALRLAFCRENVRARLRALCERRTPQEEAG